MGTGFPIEVQSTSLHQQTQSSQPEQGQTACWLPPPPPPFPSWGATAMAHEQDHHFCVQITSLSRNFAFLIHAEATFLTGRQGVSVPLDHPSRTSARLPQSLTDFMRSGQNMPNAISSYELYPSDIAAAVVFWPLGRMKFLLTIRWLTKDIRSWQASGHSQLLQHHIKTYPANPLQSKHRVESNTVRHSA